MVSRVFGAGAILLAGASFLQPAAQQPQETSQAATAVQSAAAPTASMSPHGTSVMRYCATCHNDRLKTANLILSDKDVDNPAAHADVWEKVVRRLRSRSMPPAGAPRPDDATYEALAGHIEDTLDHAAAASPNPGRPTVAHRLNRAEYTNAVRDLLALEIDGAALLPSDDSGGFDNLGDLLSVSPVLMEKYLSAAGKISRLAVGDPAIPADVETYTISPYLVQGDRMNEDLPFGSRGGAAIRHHFPLDGEYVIKVRLQRTDGAAYVIGLAEPHKLDMRLDGERLQLLSFGGQSVGLADGAGAADSVPPSFQQAEYERHADENLEVRVAVKAGTHMVQVTFLKQNWAPEAALSARRMTTYADGGAEHRSLTEPMLSSIAISGPFRATGPGSTPSRGRIFICTPADNAAEEPCAGKILSSLARRAYRRPVTDADVAPLLTLFRSGRQNADFEAGIQLAVQGLLVSTEFLFRLEPDPPSVAGAAYPVSDLELASRLSFFLWSSIPDDELLSLAEQKRLREPAVLEQQVRRMLADARSKALIDNFAGQWLQLRNVKTKTPNRDVFPEFDESLRAAFEQETDLFLKSILREDRSVLDLLDADYTFLNERLARHYGIPGVFGNQFRRVALADENRRGLLGQGSVLTLTALANRTSPVERGQWVLENILNAPVPDPPPNIPALKEKGEKGAQDLPMRQQMEAHRASPACRGCHALMDPIGFALEKFDAIGRWRDIDAGQPIDASGVLLDGSKFEGPAGLRQALLKRPELIAYAFTQKLLTYALGRQIEYYDSPAVRTIVRETRSSEHRWSSMVLAIVKSVPFQMRRSRAS